MTYWARLPSGWRGAQARVECGRVHAALRGRAHLSSDDIQAIALSVLRHRIICNFDAHAEGQTPDSLLKEIIQTVKAPVDGPASGRNVSAGGAGAWRYDGWGQTVAASGAAASPWRYRGALDLSPTCCCGSCGIGKYTVLPPFSCNCA